MDELKNWETFNLVNCIDIKHAFQRMCTYLFCYTYDVENLDEEHNHPGIETYPITYKGERYGFQCKHFDNRNDYDQIHSSVDALLRSEYSDTLDYYVLYCNKYLNNCKNLKDIKNKLLTKNIKLIPVCNEEILREIASKKYYVIYNLFFKNYEFLDNYKFEKTKNLKFENIIENKFIDITLTNNIQKVKLSNLPESTLPNKVIMIEGYAGSGKSIAMYYLYRFMTLTHENKFKQAAKLVHDKKQYIYINFKTHTHDCKESINKIINEIETDFKGHKAVIFFDGFDELSDSKASELATYINEIASKNCIKNIFISCRSLSIKKYYLTHNIANIDIYKIEPLSKADKLQYARKTLNTEHLKIFNNLLDNNKLLSEIEDPLCLKYITDNVMKIESDSTIFDLIKLSFEDKFNISKIKILENKKDSILYLIGNIAFEIYTKESNCISLNNLNKLIENKFPKLSYSDINNFVDEFKNCGFLIECDDGLTFQHKKVFEYFLIENIYQKYLYDINILAKTNLFKDEDLFENLFLNRLKSDAEKSTMPNLFIEYNLFKTYMGENFYYSTGTPAFMDTYFFADALCAFDDQTIIDLLENNTKLKSYFDSTKCSNMLGEYTKRIYKFIKRIKSSKTLFKYFKDTLPKKLNYSFEYAVEIFDYELDDANEYVDKVLEQYKNKEDLIFEYEFDSAFSKFIEYAMFKSKPEDRKFIVLKLNSSQLDLLCKTIFYPNLMPLLFDEDIKKVIEAQIKKLKLDTINTKIFKCFCGSASEEDEELIDREKEKIKSRSDISNNYNFIYLFSVSKKPSLYFDDYIVPYKLTLGLLKNEISCKEYVDKISDLFNYVRLNDGNYGRHYATSYFTLQLIESKLTNDNISIECCKYFLNKKYLNIQLLSRLKRAKPKVAVKVINKGVLSIILDREIMSLSSVEDKVDQLFMLSFLFNEYDYNVSLKYFYEGYAQSIIRIDSNKDIIFDPMLIKSFISVYDYLPQNDKKKYLSQIKSMAKWSQTFNGGVGIKTAVELAYKIQFNTKEEVFNFIELAKSTEYWNE
ncbi:MAG: hypothetical protein RSF40_07340, partial [Oscillospiraceae bacterium]